MKISEIISQYLLSKENKEELKQLNAWKDDTTSNIEIIKDLDIVWSESEELENYQQYDTDAAWSALELKNRKNQTHKKGQSSWLMVAACTLLITGLGYWMIALNGSEGNSSTNLQDFATNKTEVKAFNLKDQSKIWLNYSSELTQQSDFIDDRLVHLDGQAYFDIQRDTERPFIITTQNETVAVLGTAFDLNTYQGTFDLKVTEGLVSVDTGKRTIEVSANQRLVKDKGVYVKFDNFDDILLKWRFENLVFENTPLSEVLNTLSQTYQVTFTYGKLADLNNCLINTKFEDESLEDILDELVIITQLKVSKTDTNNYKIVSVNCN